MQSSSISGKRVALGLVTVVVLYLGLGAFLHYILFPEEEPPEWAYARSGFSFKTPTGERMELVRGTIETGGEFSEARVTVAPGGQPARAPIHPHQEERFEVQSGSLIFLEGDEERTVSAGETLVVPPGTPHQFFNRTDVDASFIGRLTPAGKLGLFFGQMSGLDFKPGFLHMTAAEGGRPASVHETQRRISCQ
jgi:mannose-6-phosphate isomerase-like protein (cupin superfamily)